MGEEADAFGQASDAVCPGLAPAEPVHSGPEQLLTVGGELFRVRRRAQHGSSYEYDYDWLSGPNPGYGFGMSGPLEQTDDDHLTTIRDFLAGIDPATGYLG